MELGSGSRVFGAVSGVWLTCNAPALGMSLRVFCAIVVRRCSEILGAALVLTVERRVR